MRKITSLQNSFIKSLVLLKEKTKVRRQTGNFLIEGKRELMLAFQANYKIDIILFCFEIYQENELLEYSDNIEIVQISKEIFKKLTYRNTTEGIIAVAKSKLLTFSDLKLSKNPLLLIAEGLEKPGNIGALLRTADAAKIDAVIIADSKGDLYNPNIIRSSVGCVFTNQIVIDTTDEVIRFLKKQKIAIYCATLQNSTTYNTLNYTMPTAFVVGNETTGLSEIWRESASQNVIIPMEGKIDSMNVSVAAAILIFEAKRQRS